MWGGEDEKMSVKRSFGFGVSLLVEEWSLMGMRADGEGEVEKRVWSLSISIFVVGSCGCD